MKKLVALIVLAGMVAAAITGAKYWAGTRIEREYRSALSALPASPAYRMTGESYSRGVFTSEVRSGVELSTLPGRPVAFSLVHRIAHGPLSFPGRLSPFLAVIETRLEPSASSSAAVKQFFKDYPELVAAHDRTVVDLGGRARSHFEIPPFRKTFGVKEVLVDWKGLTAESIIDNNWGKIKSSARLSGIEVSDREAVLNLEDITGASELEKNTLGLYLGDSEATFGALSFASLRSGKSVPVSLAGAKFKSSLDEKDGLLDIEFSFGIDKLVAAALTFEEFSLELQLRNIEAAFLVQLRKELDAVQGAGDRAVGPEIAARFGTFARKRLPSFVEKSPALELSQLKVSSQAGKFSGQGRLALDGTGAPVHEFAELLPLLTADADILVDEGLLRQVIMRSLAGMRDVALQNDDPAQLQAATDAVFAAQLQPLVEQGYLIRENATYRTSVRFRHGALTVNGKPIGARARR